ncbi:hypothetical protein [Streptomyces sp. NBC_01257]|uniref:hypothetical protein n=1 Tax=Streptomyces sp. NBC_01257 TaxID=2903799 RepID=UPI002DDAEC73|nr:hypothetical protein [Streptomyces sp. NBC_01257]WRZ62433.1 hypothetical protein OG408_00375 [Streptomyces sp. NBC_01257]
MPCRRTTPRPHVPLSTTTSPDSCLDTHPGQDRLLLPNPQDLGHVDLAVGSKAATRAGKTLGPLATIQGVPHDATWQVALDVLANLHGVRRPMAERDHTTHTQLLEQHLADTLHLVITPAPGRTERRHTDTRPGPPHGQALHPLPLRLLETRQTGDAALPRYAPKDITTEPR